jgi:hypothetical protein
VQTVFVVLLNIYTSSSFVGRFDSAQKYVDMLVTFYDTFLLCTSICEENNRESTWYLFHIFRYKSW